MRARSDDTGSALGANYESKGMNLKPTIGLAVAGIGIGCLALLIFGGHLLGTYVNELMVLQQAAREVLMQDGLIIPVILAYIILIAIPFIPGAEISFALLVLFGADIAGVLYLATVAALTLSFSVGQLAPARSLERALARLGFARTASLLSKQDTDVLSAQVLPIDSYRLPRWANWVIRHRLFAFAVLINIPGNSLIGGGGGIALATGASRLMTFREFLISTSLAVAPVPLFVLIGSWLDG